MDNQKTSQLTTGARPGWLWQAGSADRDWPDDADHENGNYQNKCLGCGEYFIGHKRRCFCRKCSDASKARWESLTPEQRAEEQRKADAELTAWLSSQNIGNEPRR